MNETTTTRAQDLTGRNYWSRRRSRKKRRTSRPRKPPATVLREILNNLRHSGSQPTVCELGCAPGSMLLQMASLHPEYAYCGVDYSETGLETTRDVLENAGVHATLACEDYFTYLPSEPYDLIVSFGVIEHASNPVDAIRRHADYARDGGRVAVSIPNYGTPFVKRMAERVDPTVFDSHNVSIMNLQALKDAMLCAGLSDVAIFHSGKPKLRTTCPDKTFSRMCWRMVAKVWNIFSPILPPSKLWSANLWATGRKTAVEQSPAGDDLKAAPKK